MHPITAYRWFREGKLPVPARRVCGSSWSIRPSNIRKRRGRPWCTRGSPHSDQLSDLDRQVARVAEWVTAGGGQVDEVVTEVGSALNGKRRRFLALLRDPTVERIVVEHRDRFARYGADYVEAALSAQGRTLVVVDSTGVDEDLGRDVTEILTSLCARLYGRRSAANRASKAVQAAMAPDSS